MLIYIIIALFIIVLLACIVFRKQIRVLYVGITSKKRVQRKLYRKCKVNDFLIINDLLFPIGNDKYRNIDTLIFGNKYIYVIKIIKQIGDVYMAIDDSLWRIIYDNSLDKINNPLIELNHRIQRLVSVIPDLETKDFKAIAVFTSTCKLNSAPLDDSNFVLKEDEVIKTIIEIENNSNDDIFDPKEIEKYARGIYEACKRVEKSIKNKKKDDYDD